MLRRVGVSAAASVLLAAVIANPASANDSSAVRGWNGFSVSVGGGAAKTNTEVAAQSSNLDTVDFTYVIPIISILGEAAGSSAVGTNDWEGFGTLQLGYDKRFGNFVVGALVDYDFYPDKPGASGATDVDGSIGAELFGIVPVGPFPVSNYASLSSSVELKSVWSLGGRLGYVVSPSLMVYGLGGYTQAKLDGQVDLSYFDLETFGATTVSVRAPDRLHGFFLGAGGEMKLADHVALRLEYRYANYNGESRSATTTSGDTFGAYPVELSYGQTARVSGNFDAEIHSVRGAVVLQLGQ